jgi:hypothetical protein
MRRRIHQTFLHYFTAFHHTFTIPTGYHRCNILPVRQIMTRASDTMSHPSRR